jgi:invasion protein IalB
MHRDDGGEPIYLELPDGTRLKGYLYVFHCKLDQAEKLVLVEFSLTADRIEMLKSGQAVTVTALSSKGKPVYKITLGQEQL